MLTLAITDLLFKAGYRVKKRIIDKLLDYFNFMVRNNNEEEDLREDINRYISHEDKKLSC